MRLEQFDKLKRLVDKLIDQNREMRFSLARKDKEINELKVQIEQLRNLPDNIDEESLNDLLTENERLKDKNQTVRNYLGAIVSDLEAQVVRQKNGVDR